MCVGVCVCVVGGELNGEQLLVCCLNLAQIDVINENTY